MANNLASLLTDRRTDPESFERAAKVARALEAIDSPYFKDTLGWIAYRRGDLRTALGLLEDASAKLPNNAVVRYHLGMTYIALKRNSDAKKELDAARATAGADQELLSKIDDAEKSL